MPDLNIAPLWCRPLLLLLGDPEVSVRTAALPNLAVSMEGIAGKSARDDAKLGAELAGHVTSLEEYLGSGPANAAELTPSNTRV